MQVAVGQTNPVLGELDTNVERVCELVGAARRDGAQHIVLPELALSGYSLGAVDVDLSIPRDDERLREIARAALPAGVVVGFVEDGPSVQTYNSAAYLAGGEVVHVHRKLYLPTYKVFEERKHFNPGQSLRSFPAAGTRMATLICNDAWQPPIGFLAVQDGARVLNVPTNSAQSLFPEHYDAREYWLDLTRFLGRMCQTFVIVANRVGVEEPLRFWGGSSVVDPWGEVVVEAPLDVEAVVHCEVDLGRVRQRRRDVPLVREARLGLLEREIRRIAEEGGDR